MGNVTRYAPVSCSGSYACMVVDKYGEYVHVLDFLKLESELLMERSYNDKLLLEIDDGRAVYE